MDCCFIDRLLNVSGLAFVLIQGGSILRTILNYFGSGKEDSKESEKKKNDSSSSPGGDNKGGGENKSTQERSK
ncbi:hypothetical protein [Chitiniphilus eburneus]|uniref:Uncharacterized protein n=1 Tax=Chitiniphilus eburneus TaxID=2571148 RepID=A0A4U0QBS2_9NEIS|nr:hypothetical protein [Chitiniphilus eburneus]TJZ73284.1 hypothetical protein FAZ21_10485 [Chitiniphilus eburneus]